MSQNSKIEWTDATWNPVSGCSKVSAGCKNCYAEKIAERFKGSKAFPDGFKVTLHPERLSDPLHWRKPKRVFVNSMSDLFHEEVPFKFILEIFGVMAKAKRHTFQVLTKRPERMLEFIRKIGGIAQFPNIQLGVSAEDQKTLEQRLPPLLACRAAVHFLSAEPLLGPLDITTVPWTVSGYLEPPHNDVLNWVICGGESGPGARPMHEDWARGLLYQCQVAGIPFFFKQWGQWLPYRQATPEQKWATGTSRSCLAGDGNIPMSGHWLRLSKKSAGRRLDGREWNEFPESPMNNGSVKQGVKS